MDTPPPPFELPATGVLWDDRFILSRMTLGIAAGCWVLAVLQVYVAFVGETRMGGLNGLVLWRWLT